MKSNRTWFAAVLLVAACGSKNAATTPSSTAGATTVSDHSKAVDAPPAAPAPAKNDSKAAADKPVTADVDKPKEVVPPEPVVPIIPPNLDPDPAKAKADVDEHLKTGRAALSGDHADPDVALREARLALTIDASSVDAAVLVAHAYYMKHLYDTAEVILDELFKRDAAKSNAGVFYLYGLVYDQVHKQPQAFLSYKKAVEINPNYTSALVNLGVHQLRNKQYTDAIATYEKLTQSLQHGDAETWSALGASYRGRSSDYPKGSPDRDALLRKSEGAFKRALQADRNYGAASYDLGLLYLDADPFPGEGNGSMDTLVRLQQAKSYFDQYKNMVGADIKLYDERDKDVTKLIKREEKKRKRAAAGAAK